MKQFSPHASYEHSVSHIGLSCVAMVKSGYQQQYNITCMSSVFSLERVIILQVYTDSVLLCSRNNEF